MRRSHRIGENVHTERLKVGTRVPVMPLYHPVRLTAEIA